MNSWRRQLKLNVLQKWFEGDNEYDDKPHYAPILLITVEIVKKSASSGYVIKGRGEETMVNITLLEFLRQLHGINLSGLEYLQKNTGGIDSSLVFNGIWKMYREMNVMLSCSPSVMVQIRMVR